MKGHLCRSRSVILRQHFAERSGMLMQEGSPDGYVQRLLSCQYFVLVSVSRSQKERKAIGRPLLLAALPWLQKGTPLTGAKSKDSLP